MQIKRHKIDPEAIRRRYETTRDAIPLFIRGARRDPNNLTLLASNSLDVARALSVLDPNAPEIRQSVRLASQSYGALFAVAVSVGRRVEVPLGDDIAVYEAYVEGSLVHSTRWIDAYLLAALCQDTDSLNFLCRTPMELLCASSTGGPAYRKEFVRALIAYRDSRTDTAALILEAIKQTDPDRDDIHAANWTLRLDVPLLELLFYIHRKDPDFETALPKALQRYKEYWTATPARKWSWDGFIAFNLLGMAALAADAGMAFHIDSDYMPGLLQKAL